MPRSLWSFVLVILALAAGVAYAQAPKGALTVYQAISTPDFGYLPTYVARAKNYFADERLDLKVIVMNSRVSVPALIANEVHFGVEIGRASCRERV